MSLIAKIALDNDSLVVSGDINFETAVGLWDESLPLLSNCKQLSFDFSQVKSVNSAALALLLEWLKYAKEQNKLVSFNQLPQQLFSIAKVAGVEKLLISH